MEHAVLVAQDRVALIARAVERELDLLRVR